MPGWLRRLIELLTGHAPDPTPRPPPVPGPTPAPSPGPPPISEMVATMNGERRKAGLEPFVENFRLDAVAQGWANYLATTGVLAHGLWYSRIAAVFPNAACSENVAAGQPNVQRVVSAWMSSPGHRGNILGGYNQVGWGVAKTPSGNTFWVVDFILQ